MAEAANTSAVLQELLAQASRGDKDALGQLLELHRGYLRALAQRQLGGVAARLDASDLLQQTCLSACRNFKQFQEHRVGPFVAWLRRIHERNIQDAIREHVHAGHRAVNREQPMAERWERSIATNRPSSPSGRLLGTEQAVVLTVALDERPTD